MSDFTDDIADLIRQGRKIEAIKLLRERTGMGLAAAKDAVERAASGTASPAAAAPRTGAPAGDDLPPEVRALLDQKQAIAAIKRLRELTGLGLKEAKERIDRATGGAHRVGCGGVLLAALATAAAAGVAMLFA